ncbi:MAG TPA: DUF3311 domain-containing protein [Ktedonobacterales bacterium]|nr:DUF3311 domain-containing protein [Ktedonobacterales bacterium]
MANEPTTGSKGKQAWYILLIIPFVATLWMPFYAPATLPAWNGIPFFYWYMFLWIIISSVLTGIVYYIVK